MLKRSLVLVVVLIAACASPQPPGTNTPEAGAAAGSASGAVEIIKSPNDDREFRYLELPNRLKVVLVTDPASDKAAAMARRNSSTSSLRA